MSSKLDRLSWRVQLFFEQAALFKEKTLAGPMYLIDALVGSERTFSDRLRGRSCIGYIVREEEQKHQEAIHALKSNLQS